MIERNRHPKPRTPFGERLTAARIRAGLTQAELGEKIGMSQRGIANWEIRTNSSPNPEQLAKLSTVLDITVEELVCGNAENIRQKSGPRGKLLKLFHEAADLPRRQRDDVAEVLAMYVRAKRKKIADRQEVLTADA
jgi:transcriptional regulator with XRE-family HTH domain